MSKYRDAEVGYREGSTATSRPACVTDDHLEFLDMTRAQGTVNMYGARPVLMAAFDELSDREAATVHGYWMKTFGDANR